MKSWFFKNYFVSENNLGTKPKNLDEEFFTKATSKKTNFGEKNDVCIHWGTLYNILVSYKTTTKIMFYF